MLHRENCGGGQLSTQIRSAFCVQACEPFSTLVRKAGQKGSFLGSCWLESTFYSGINVDLPNEGHAPPEIELGWSGETDSVS